MLMKKIIFFLVILSLPQCLTAQAGQLWKGYFSYSGIKDVSQTNTSFFAASENAIFVKNTISGDVRTINTIDGLSSQTISAIYQSPIQNKLLIGYENGLLLIVDKDNKIYKFVDIINKQIPPNIKKINHFYEYENSIYISCDFGIVRFNLSTQLFGDTYFIGTSPSEIKVHQTTVFRGFLYAATDQFGLKRADITNPNLIDANNWTTAVTGNFNGVVSTANFLICSQGGGQNLSSSDGISFSTLNPFSAPAAVDIRICQNQLVITSPNKIVVYNENLNVITQVLANQVPNISCVFTSATIVGEKLYMGTAENGVITTTVTNNSLFDFITPSGPILNNIFSVNATTPNLWAVYGDVTESLAPLGQRRGYSKYTVDAGWKNYPYSAVSDAADLVRVTVNPFNINQIFIAAHGDGLLKIENEVVTKHYKPENSGLEYLPFSDPNYKSCRIEEPAFDKKGSMWLTNGLLKSPLKVLLANGNWQSYNMEALLPDFMDARFTKLLVDKNSTKWMVARGNGLIGFNENYNNKFKKIPVGEDDGNLPAIVQAAAIDNRNQIWIGTRRGLRMLSSVDAFLDEEQMKAKSIIIIDNGLAQELMYEQFITDIVVDGANNKWISTADAGVFQFSPNGQETLHRFNAENSPLPSNYVNDVDINPLTGEVFFATNKGMVSYKGTAIKAANDLENVVVFPNPVRPEFEGNVTITGLTNKANVKITDIEGNLVHEHISEGGSIEWNTTAFGKYRVASGVYMIFVSSRDGELTKTKKVMIVR